MPTLTLSAATAPAAAPMHTSMASARRPQRLRFMNHPFCRAGPAGVRLAESVCRGPRMPLARNRQLTRRRATHQPGSARAGSQAACASVGRPTAPLYPKSGGFIRDSLNSQSLTFKLFWMRRRVSRVPEASMRGWSPRAGALVRAARVQLHATGRDACARLGNPQGTPADLERRTGRRAPEPRPLRRADGLYLALRRRSPDRTRQTAGFHAGASAAARARIECGGVRVDADPACAAVIAPNRPLRLHWEAGCEQLLLKIPRGKLDAIGQRAFGEPRCGRWTSARAAAGQPGGRRLAQHDGRPDPPAAHAGRRRAAPAGRLAGPARGHAGAAPAVQPAQHLARRAGGHAATPPALAEAYMRAHLATPMTLKDIARHAGASDTALTRLFQEHRDTTPMNALRALRLDAARQRRWTAPAPTSPRRRWRWASATWAGFRSTTRKDSANCPGRPCAWRSDRGRAAALAPAPAIRCRMPAR